MLNSLHGNSVVTSLQRNLVSNPQHHRFSFCIRKKNGYSNTMLNLHFMLNQSILQVVRFWLSVLCDLTNCDFINHGKSRLDLLFTSVFILSIKMV